MPSAIIETNSAMVSVNVGKAMLTGTRPAHSHRPSTTRIEATRSTHGCVARFVRLLAGAATGAPDRRTGVSTATGYSSTASSAACIGSRVQKSSTCRLAGSPVS